MNEQERAFLNAISEDEMDHVSRCAYADWLLENDRPEEAERQRGYVPSRKWMLEFAKRNHCYGKYHNWEEEEQTGMRYGRKTNPAETAEKYYQDFMEYLKGHVGANEGNFGFDLPYDFDGYSDEMWHHFEVLTCLKAPAKDDKDRTKMPEHFRCSC